MEVWQKTHFFPQDILAPYHTPFEECWCHAGEYKDGVIHRQANMIDKCGEEGKYITGFVILNV